jgi:hypothetical protein
MATRAGRDTSQTLPIRRRRQLSRQERGLDEDLLREICAAIRTGLSLCQSLLGPRDLAHPPRRAGRARRRQTRADRTELVPPPALRRDTQLVAPALSRLAFRVRLPRRRGLRPPDPGSAAYRRGPGILPVGAPRPPRAPPCTQALGARLAGRARACAGPARHPVLRLHLGVGSAHPRGARPRSQAGLLPRVVHRRVGAAAVPGGSGDSILNSHPSPRISRGRLKSENRERTTRSPQSGWHLKKGKKGKKGRTGKRVSEHGKFVLTASPWKEGKYCESFSGNRRLHVCSE